MNERVEKLKSFIEKYGRDFLGYGTKDTIVEALGKDDDEALKLWGEITEAISSNSNWMNRTKELGYFYIFTDYALKRELNGKEFPYYDASRPISSASEQVYDIPTLRVMEPRLKYRDGYTH